MAPTPTNEHPYRIGDRDGLNVEVRPTFGIGDAYDVTIFRSGSGSSVQPNIADPDKAVALADHLYAVLLPEYEREVARLAQQIAADRARRNAEAPKREAERKAHLRAAKAAPLVEAQECASCGHVAEPHEYDEPRYECGTCGTGGRGEDARRCAQCHKFTAKVADHSCPECEEDASEAALVQARQMPDGSLVLESDVQAL